MIGNRAILASRFWKLLLELGDKLGWMLAGARNDEARIWNSEGKSRTDYLAAKVGFLAHYAVPGIPLSFVIRISSFRAAPLADTYFRE